MEILLFRRCLDIKGELKGKQQICEVASAMELLGNDAKGDPSIKAENKEYKELGTKIATLRIVDDR